MKWTFKAILAGVILLTIAVGCIVVGFVSANNSVNHPEVMAVKPWQPMARIAFGFIMATFTLIFGGALLKAIAPRL
jgi:hypothetical protein